MFFNVFRHYFGTLHTIYSTGISAEQLAVLDEHETLTKGAKMQSYNGKIAKYVTIAEVSLAGEQRTLSRGTITKSTSRSDS